MHRFRARPKLGTFWLEGIKRNKTKAPFHRAGRTPQLLEQDRTAGVSSARAAPLRHRKPNSVFRTGCLYARQSSLGTLPLCGFAARPKNVCGDHGLVLQEQSRLLANAGRLGILGDGRGRCGDGTPVSAAYSAGVASKEASFILFIVLSSLLFRDELSSANRGQGTVNTSLCVV